MKIFYKIPMKEKDRWKSYILFDFNKFAILGRYSINVKNAPIKKILHFLPSGLVKFEEKEEIK